jgi:hypothetical protein
MRREEEEHHEEKKKGTIAKTALKIKDVDWETYRKRAKKAKKDMMP